MLRIYSRAEWGARYRDGYDAAPIPAPEVFLHHSVTTHLSAGASFEQECAEMRKLEEIGEKNFRAGISYSFPIFPSGRVFEGHTIRRAGAHTIGHNYTGRAICFVGNYETNEPTDAQLSSAANLLVHGRELGWFKYSYLTGGHRDVYQTACPGIRAYSKIGEINRRAAAGGDDVSAPEVWDHYIPNHYDSDVRAKDMLAYLDEHVNDLNDKVDALATALAALTAEVKKLTEGS